MEASSVEQTTYLRLSNLKRQEFFGMASALVLLASLWMPWFTTSDNPQSKLNGQAGIDTSAWEQFAFLDFILLLAVIAPFILSWIIARGHKLSWQPGEVTAIAGITAGVLILCNGVILGRPGDSVEIGLTYGYFVALLGAIGILASGFLRSSETAGPRKPPGEL